MSQNKKSTSAPKKTTERHFTKAGPKSGGYKRRSKPGTTPKAKPLFEALKQDRDDENRRLLEDLRNELMVTSITAANSTVAVLRVKLAKYRKSLEAVEFVVTTYVLAVETLQEEPKAYALSELSRSPLARELTSFQLAHAKRAFCAELEYQLA